MRALGFLLFVLPPLYLLMLAISLAWPVDEPALVVYRDQVPRLVATDLRKWNTREVTPDGGRSGWKAYVLFPSVLREPTVVTVTVLPDGARVVSESRAEFCIRFALALVSFALAVVPADLHACQGQALCKRLVGDAGDVTLDVVRVDINA